MFQGLLCRHSLGYDLTKDIINDKEKDPSAHFNTQSAQILSYSRNVYQDSASTSTSPTAAKNTLLLNNALPWVEPSIRSHHPCYLVWVLSSPTPRSSWRSEVRGPQISLPPHTSFKPNTNTQVNIYWRVPNCVSLLARPFSFCCFVLGLSAQLHPSSR